MPLPDLPAAVAVLGRPRVKVAVCVMTYNQRDFIAPCLDSLVAQSLDEPFELLVMDDCSTDGTSDVVADYARRFGERVVHLRQPRNLEPYLNYQLVHELACQRSNSVGGGFWIWKKISIAAAAHNVHIGRMPCILN